MKVKLIICCFLAHVALSQDYWELKDSMNGPPRAGMASFVLGNRGYVVGGIKADGNTRKMYSYSQTQNDWDDETPLGNNPIFNISGGGLERNLACAFQVYGKGYVCLGEGEGSGYMNDLWVYDKNTQVWTQKANFIGSARRGASSFVVNNVAYVGTGEDCQGLCDDFYRYDAAENMWHAINSFPGGARRQAVGFELNGYGWVATGDAGVLKRDLWSYNVVTDQWQQKSNLPGNARLGAVAWSTSPSAYIATGQDATGVFLNDVWQYNYYQNAWSSKNIYIGGGRVNATAFVINGTAYLGGGYNGAYLDDFYSYHGVAALQEEAASLILYPNPSVSWIKIDGLDGPSAYTIFSASGTRVSAGITSSHESISTENLANGAYIIALSRQHNTVCRSFIKH
jgi:N-acetylneuraminic acid mutarotase